MSFSQNSYLVVQPNCSQRWKKHFACNICKMNFAERKHLRIHMNTHTRETHFSCDQCESQFTNTMALKQHRIRTHDDKSKKKRFACVQCSKSFTSLIGLSTHIQRLHTTVRSFSCDHCTKKFVDKSDLKRHEIVHSKESPFDCNMCSKSFKKADLLKTTFEGPY